MIFFVVIRQRVSASPFYLLLFVDAIDAGLPETVTDSGLNALASAGCGAHLVNLILESESLHVYPCDDRLVVNESVW